MGQAADFSDTRFAFIVGAPRSGTTFLARHLQQHPDICFSKPKEPHFFAANDLRGLDDDQLRAVVRKDYLDLFFPHCRAGSMLAEGSVTYLYVPEQMEPVLRLWPKAKFIIAVRDPMQLLPSLHQRLRCIGDETIASFDEAWGEVPERRAGRNIPRRCADPRWLNYWEGGKLGSYLQRLFDVVGRERCFISIFDDLIADPARQYREVLGFLGLPDDGQQDFPMHRQSSGFKYQWLQHLLKRPPRVALSLFGSELHKLRINGPKQSKKSGLASAVLKARESLLEWNKAPAPSVEMSETVAAEIRSMFADDVALLESLLGRRLDHWLGRGGAQPLRPWTPDRATHFGNNPDIHRDRRA